MDKRLFVGGLPFSVNNKALEELFAQCGNVVSADVISDRYTNQSKGFGFVEMSTSEEAQEAIKKLNNYEVEGRKIVVTVARPKEERPRPNGGNFSPRRNDRDRGGRGHGDRRGGGRNRW